MSALGRFAMQSLTQSCVRRSASMCIMSKMTATSSSSMTRATARPACAGMWSSFSTVAQRAETKEKSPAASIKTAEIVKPVKTVVHHPFAINDLPLEADKPSPKADRFAIVALSGTQFKVSVDDTIVADYRDDVDIGDIIDYPEVLLVGSRRATVVGRPFVPGSVVRCAVEELTRDRKVITFKTRRRKSSRSIRGFRARVMILRVQEIAVGSDDENAL
jgi:large subunit ribosomal protein L21